MALSDASGLPFMDIAGEDARFDLKALCRGHGDGDWQALLSELLSILQQSPLAAALLQRAIRRGWALGMTAADDMPGHYFYRLDAAEKILWLDHGGFSAAAIRRTPHCREALCGSLVRGLRDIGHDMRLGAYESAMRPDAVLMMERARAADIETICVLVAWELRGAGHPALWRQMLGSEDGDLALTFGYTLETNPRSLYDGRALAQTFLRWYADPMRANACDHDTLEMLDYILEQRDPRTGWGRLSFTAEDARDLSILPDGLAYLKDEAAMVAQSPDYHRIDDAINEAHLFQITHDTRAISIAGVPFRSASLARKIFPTAR